MRRQSKEIKTNLEVLGKAKQRPESGDIFVFKPKDREYYFGLVINANIRIVDYFGRRMSSPDWDGVLAYVYDQHAPAKEDIPRLDLRKLLLPPLILDVWCWRMGYVERVGEVPLASMDLLHRHCFCLPPLSPGGKEQYLDEHGQRLEERHEPCGGYGLTPFRGFDDEVSRALGIAPVPD